MALLRRTLFQCHRTAALLRCSPRVCDVPLPIQLGIICHSVRENRFFSSDPVTRSGSSSHILDENRRRELNKLLYRSRQRGLLELDLVLGKWVEENIQSLDDDQIKALVEVLDMENPDLWRWLTSQEPAPEALLKNPVFSVLHEKISKKLDNYSSPETRAEPGQPWVRGWDDKRETGGPVAGNQ